MAKDGVVEGDERRGIAAACLSGGVQSVSVQSVSVHFSHGQGSRSRLIVLIQEPYSYHAIRAPLKVDGPALPGAQEWNPTSLKGRQGVGRTRSWHPLADHDGPWPGPGVEHRRVRSLAAVVGGAQCTNG